MRARVAAVLTAALALTACGGSPDAAPPPSAVPLRDVAVCPATVVVPDEAVEATLEAATPTTVVLTIGEAVSFAVPDGARVGLTAAADPDADAALCSAPAAPAGTRTFVAQSLGYSRVGVQVGIDPPSELLLRVTP